MGELCGVPALAQCTFTDLFGRFGVEAFRACDLFHRDVTAEEGVAGQPDGAHPSVADLGAESVPPRQQVFGPDAPPGLLLSCHISRLMD